MKKLFYASSGRANVIRAHLYWKEGKNDPTEVSITFSSQIEDLCKNYEAEAVFVSDRGPADELSDDFIFLKHRPKRQVQGWRYFIEDLRYAWALVRDARAFGAELAVIDSGVTQFFMMSLFPLFGIPVIPVLHNSLWANGFRPTGFRNRMVQSLDRWFWRRVPLSVLAVSPECERQVKELAGRRHRPILQVRAQFHRERFYPIPPPNPDSQPLHVMFIGRVVPDKGVLDIVKMARMIEDDAPGEVCWTICGTGSALEQVRSDVAELGLSDVVQTPGWVTLEALQTIYAESHLSIVPTRSGFCEGLAMTAAEAILAGRPLVSNPIVPALELLAPAAMEARSEDVASHAHAVLTLARDRQLYRKLQKACASLEGQFYDRKIGLTAVLDQVISTL